jgi:chromate reductase
MIEIIVGTNRRGSLSQVLGKCLLDKYLELSVEAQLMSLQDLPPETFTPDAYQDKPVKVIEFTQRVQSSKGLVIITPEYNGSMPGALKLFIDLLPFPESFENRPVCYVGVAAGQFGGLRPVEHAMQVFGYRNAYNYPKRVFLADSYRVIDPAKGITDEEISSRLSEQAKGFIQFCNSLKNRD